MDLSTRKNFDPWRYILGIGAGLGVGYFLYKSFFTKPNHGHSKEKLSKIQADKRSDIIQDIKYNLFFKMRYILEETNTSFHHQRAAVKGILEFEITLSDIVDLSMDFGGSILEFNNLLSKQKVKYSHDREAKNIVIHKSNFIRGTNKFSIEFFVKDCDKGIMFNDKIYFTDFQPNGAHYLFPCFDQPDIKSEINLFLALPKNMQAFSVTNYRLVDLNHYNDPDFAENILYKSLDIINRDEFNYFQFKTTPKIPLYSFFFCAGDFKCNESSYDKRKISQRIIVPKNRCDISEENQKIIFNFTEIFMENFKKTFNCVNFENEFINHVFLPHSIEMREKSLDGLHTFIYSDIFIDKIKNRNELIFFLTLIGKNIINQVYGHSITIKWWDDFWFKESISIFLSYDLINRISHNYNHSLTNIMKTKKEIEELKDIWSLFIKFNTKGYTFDRNNKKNHPVLLEEIENLEEIYKIKDEITYCKGPNLIKYLCYLIGHDEFFLIFSKFISTFKNSSATYNDFISLLYNSSNKIDSNKIKSKINHFNDEFLRSRCPPVIRYEIQEDYKNKIRNILFTEVDIEGLNCSPSMLQTDILFVYLNKTSNYSIPSIKTENYKNIDILDQSQIRESLNLNEEKPDFVLLNYTDNSYLIQKFTEEQCEWLRYHINLFKDPFIISIIVRNLLLMTYNKLYSPKKLIQLLLDLLLIDNNIFIIDHYLKMIIFLINEFIPNQISQNEYKLKLFETISDTLAKTESLKCINNIFIRHLIDCTNNDNKEELVKLIEYIASNEFNYGTGLSKRSSGILNTDFNEFSINDLLKLPDNLSEKITQDNLKRLLILILESDVIAQECITLNDISDESSIDYKQPITCIKTLNDVKEVLIAKFYGENCSDEIKLKIHTILNPSDAWKKIVNISNSKSYLIVNNWILERVLKPKPMKRLGIYNYDTFNQIVENSITNQNYDFLERFFKYSQDLFPANEDTKTLYYRCAKILEGQTNKKNYSQVDKIIHILYTIHHHICKKMEIIETYESLWSGKDDLINNSLDNSQTY